MSTAVIIATRRRPLTLRATLSVLAEQTSPPASIIVCCVDDDDVGEGALPAGVTVVKGRQGLAAQRNSGLRHLPPATDVVVFFDDDFFPHRRWIEEVENHFARHANVAGITGHVLADGIHGPGIEPQAARALLAATDIESHRSVRAPFSPYGCNMAFRVSTLAGLSFDERLVLYGWQEDRDFGAQVARRGAVLKLGAAVGVHLGVKGGRVSGRQFGYSQVANVLYLRRKGTVSLYGALELASRNLLANSVRAIWPEPHIDRYGRLRGNFLALRDAVRGRVEPERAAEI